VRSIAAMRQAGAALEAHVTKLLTDAIGFLADKDKLELRLGAIYALERIAQKSRTDRSRVLEILYAFIRENTKRQTTSEPSAVKQISPDIQACLDVIARKPTPEGIFWKGLSQTDAGKRRLTRCRFAWCKTA
jgi:hypothetical protein